MRARALLVIATGILLGLGLVLVRGEPRVWGDPGVWLSIGARLLDGDRLYVDVVDNKDPLFYYSYAGALWIGGWRGPFALDGVWLSLAAIGMAAMLYELRAGWPAIWTGLFVYPFALTAAWYDPGATLLAALSLAPLSAWLWLRGRFAAAAATVGMAMLFKLNLALIVAAPLAALFVLGSAAASRRHQLAWAAGGLSAALGAAAVVLAARGELRPYVEIVDYNVYYSNAGLRSLGVSEGIAGHTHIARDFFESAGRWQAPLAVTLVATFLVVAAIGWRRFGAPFQQLSTVTAATVLAGVVTASLTVIFWTHLQMLAYPTALLAVTLVAAASRALGMRGGAAAAALCIVFAAWSSLKHEDLSNLSLRPWTTSQASTPGLALEKARAEALPGERGLTYMVFGRNTEDGHAAFIDDSFALSCRWFHQYPFYRQEQFSETLECARRERPMLVLVTQSFYDPKPNSPRWEAFVASARRLLTARYELVTELGMSEVWKLR